MLALDNCLYEKNHLKSLIQIENDIPRLHQYSYIMNSFLGKKHLYQLLTCWLNLNESYTYVQGLDSIALAASEICNWEPNASMILFDQILKKFFPNFIDSETTLKKIKERIHLIEWILAFVEPSLALHLKKIGFSAELYAISWFITLFSSKKITLRYKHYLRRCLHNRKSDKNLGETLYHWRFSPLFRCFHTLWPEEQTLVNGY